MSFNCPYCNWNDHIRYFKKHYINEHTTKCEMCDLLHCTLEAHFCPIKTRICQYCNVKYIKSNRHECKMINLKNWYSVVDNQDDDNTELLNNIKMRIIFRQLLDDVSLEKK